MTAPHDDGRGSASQEPLVTVERRGRRRDGQSSYGAVEQGQDERGQTSEEATLSLTSRRVILSTMFAMLGYMFGYFQSQLPVTKERLAITDAHFGLLLLSDDVGCFTGQFLATRGSSRLRSDTFTPFAGAIAVFAARFANTATSPAQFGISLFCNGFMYTLFDIAINIQFVVLGTLSGKAEAPFFHGMMSAGQLVGSLVGMSLTRLHVPFERQVSLTAFGLAFAYLVHFPIVRWQHRQVQLRHSKMRSEEHSTSAAAEPSAEEEVAPATSPNPSTASSAASTLSAVLRRRRRAILLLAALGGLSSIGEGGTPEWSGIYLRQNLKTSFDIANTAALACAAGMALTRFAGSALNGAFGAKAVIRWGSAFSAASMAFGLWYNQPTVFLFAVACTGAGLANITPLSIAMLSGIPDDEEQARAVTRLSIAQNIGFFTGPPFVGFFSGLMGLRLALAGVISFTGLAIALLSMGVRQLT